VACIGIGVKLIDGLMYVLYVMCECMYVKMNVCILYLVIVLSIWVFYL
jgi:hypothetical protein